MRTKNKSEFMEDHTREMQELKDSITPEERDRLKTITETLLILAQSMSSNDQDSIKHNYGSILQEQEEGRLNSKKIAEGKSIIWQKISSAYPALLLATTDKLSPNIEMYLSKKNINLKNLPEELLENSAEFLKQQLTVNPQDNKFRLPIWIEKIRNTQNTIKPLLDYTI